jgi:para-aminobenzoate synthetase/4-amino-4-deoxychorismate lyase
MELIAALEGRPRGFYTGSLGWAGPERARFNVAIRTAVVDRERGTIQYGVGSGIVADSRPAEEYAECLLKARILEEAPFALLETLALTPGEGFRRRAGHLERLARSARYFGIPVEAAAPALDALAEGLREPSRVRLLLDLFGRASVESAPLPEARPGPLRVALAGEAVASGSLWLRHKTTRREVYDRALRARPDCDDVLLFNERGELTESCLANVALEVAGGRLVTPPVACGLLPGVERAALLAEGQLLEGVIRLSDLSSGQHLWLMNSVRGLQEAVLVG